MKAEKQAGRGWKVGDMSFSSQEAAEMFDSHSKRYTVLAGNDSPMAIEAASLAKHYSNHVWQWESAADMETMLSTLAEATGKTMLQVTVPN